MRNLSLLFMLLCFTFAAQAQCLMYPVTLSQRISQSSLVVEGKVVNQQCFWNAAHNRIYTSNLIEVYKSFKGTSPAYLEVITEGGTVGMNRHHIDPSLELETGETGVFTLNANGLASQFGKPVYEPYAAAQGFIKYNLKENSANEPFQAYTNLSTTLYPLLMQLCGESYSTVKPLNLFAQTVSTNNSVQSVAAITGFSPSTITADTFSVLTINGSGFGATRITGAGTATVASFVEFKNADDGGSTYVQPHASQYVSWSDAQIQVIVPTSPGTAGSGVFRVDVGGVKTTSTSSLTVNYGHLNLVNANVVLNTKHINQSGGGYVWTYNTNFLTNAAATAAFERSLGAWRCATYINWTLAATTSSINAGVNDNVNIVTFQTNLPAGVLGQCASYFLGCFQSGDIVFYVSELDIVFSNTPGGLSWQYGPAAPTSSQYDFESVTVHELGHGHQLSHVINNSDLMHYGIANGQSKRNLNTDDLNGGLAVMARNTVNPVCSKPLMTPLNSSNCSLGPNAAFSTSSGSLCANATLTLTSTSTGATSYTWTMTGGTPATASTSVATVAYATAGVKTITLSAGSGSQTSTTTKTITVVANPTVNVTPTATTACAGQAHVLSASGGTSWLWSPGGATTASISVTPTLSTTYTITGTTAGCSNTKTISITVSPNPTVTASNSGGICTGTATLSASGATSYTWNPGALSGASVNVSPAATTVYTVTGLSGSCSSTKTTTLTVTAQPTINLSASSATVCQGIAAGITASGASTYTWNPGGLSGTAPSLMPATTTTYSVSGSNGGCSSATRTTVVTVNPSPTVTAASSQSLICVGQSATITSSGASTYTTNPGGLSGSPVGVSPGSTTTYTVTGTTAGCSKSATVTIVVSPCTGIDEGSGLAGMALYPNPNGGVFNILNPQAQQGLELKLYNAMGQLLLSEKLLQEITSLDLSPYGKGIYYAVIDGQNSHQTIKLLVH